MARDGKVEELLLLAREESKSEAKASLFTVVMSGIFRYPGPIINAFVWCSAAAAAAARLLDPVDEASEPLSRISGLHVKWAVKTIDLSS